MQICIIIIFYFPIDTITEITIYFMKPIKIIKFLTNYACN
jgi:hypothetical protein